MNNPQPNPCPTCGGSGKYQEQGLLGVDPPKCARCHGTGYVNPMETKVEATSTCHNAPVRLGTSGGGTTHWFICSSCWQPCDVGTGTVQPPRRPRCPECGSDNPAESFNTNWNCDNPFHTPTPDTQPSRPVKIDPEIQATISDLPPTPDTTDSSGGNNNE